MTSRAQASEVHYDLQSLGWKSFQNLCTAVVSEVLGQTVEAFLPSQDGGRDGAFHGKWKPRGGDGLAGSFTVQAKFTSKETSLRPSDLNDELVKAERLGARGLATNYILMTNYSVSAKVAATIRGKFLSIEGIKHFLVFGKEWITLKIQESPRLRMLVPRVYGLGDLTQILDERAYTQAVEILSSLGDDLSKFVFTQAYALAARALQNHGFVLLLGEPASGKSTIAACLALGALDLWDCSTLKVGSAREFTDHWNPNDPKQFFWVDDAFGTTQYLRELAQDWNRTFPHARAAIRRGGRVLFTSRDYIFRAAKNDLKIESFPLLNESQVVIHVQRLSLSEKEQMLYNHVKLGEQPRYFKTRIKPFLPSVAASLHFLPEIARRLGNPLFTRDLSFDRASVQEFVERPIQFLSEVVSTLDPQSKAALALVFMRGGSLESPVTLSRQEEQALGLLGVSVGAARDALVALNGSLVSLVRVGGNPIWKFKHPTIGDAFASMVAEDPELLDIYLSWTSPDKLLQEVTCGDVGIEGAKVIVPANRFARFTARLAEVAPGRHLYTFLATRCSREFLEQYLRKHPTLGARIVEPSSYLSVVSEVDVLIRLHEFGILPEGWRRLFVQHARKLAVETPDVDFLAEKSIRSLFTEQEIAAIAEVIRAELIPSFDAVIDSWRDGYDSDEDPEAWFDPLARVIRTLRGEFSGDRQVQEQLNAAEGEIDTAIDDLREDYSNRDEESASEWDRAWDRGSASEGRSVFEDIDE